MMMKILFVDDEPQILELLQLIFDWEQLGFEIVGTASNGLEALALLDNHNVDILITDVNMPHMDGLELIKNARINHPNMSVVIISAYDDFNYVKQALSLNVADYLLKPIEEEEFLQILENLKEKHAKNLLHNDSTNNNYIRSNLLNRLIKNRISYLEIEEKHQFLNLSLDHSFYNIIIIKVKTPIRFGSLVLELSYHLSISKETFELFEDFDNNLVLLIGDKNEEQLNLSVKNKNDIILPLLQEKGIDYIISTGSVVDDVLDISKSYLKAQRLAGDIIVQNEKINFSNKELFQSIPNSIDFKTLKKMFLDSDYNDAHAFIATALLPFKENPSLPFDANNLGLRLIAWIDNFYDELNISLQESSQYYDYLILGILQSTSTDELLSYIIEHIQLYRNQKEIRTKNYSPIISQIKAHVDENYNENISLKSLSNKYHVNSSYLGQLFNNEIGEYFNDYLNKLRNQKALDLLLNTDLTNYEIAMALGYTETSYFYKKFKAFHGVAPNAFRKKKQ